MSSGNEYVFIVDYHLGRLAKWLRLCGFDTIYCRNISTLAATNIVRQKQGIFITRNLKQEKLKRFSQFIVLKTENILDQLSELNKIIPLNTDNLFSRCPICNENLNIIDKESIKERIPAYVLETNNEFKLCPKCKKIYWKGTHHEKILATLSNL